MFDCKIKNLFDKLFVSVTKLLVTLFILSHCKKRKFINCFYRDVSFYIALVFTADF
jgi:hypothetical protein